MKTKRLFVAVNLPFELKARLYSMYCKILNQNFKLVEVENLHLTLKFLGNFPEEKILELCEKLSKLSSLKAFNANIGDFGCFGKNILWISVKEGCEELKALNAMINELLEVSEEKKFFCHLTIARNKIASNAEFSQALQELKKLKISESFRIESVELMESELLPQGPRYKIVESFKLS